MREPSFDRPIEPKDDGGRMARWMMVWLMVGVLLVLGLRALLALEGFERRLALFVFVPIVLCVFWWYRHWRRDREKDVEVYGEPQSRRVPREVWLQTLWAVAWIVASWFSEEIIAAVSKWIEKGGASEEATETLVTTLLGLVVVAALGSAAVGAWRDRRGKGALGPSEDDRHF